MTLLEIPSQSIRERSIPVLETERLVLRAPRLGDAKAVVALANDRRIAENTARIPHPYRIADAEDFIAGANLGTETVFVITQRNGAVIGACGFVQVDRHPPEIGYWLGVKHWGKGYATEALEVALDYGFHELRLNRVEADIDPRNGASAAVLERLGFRKEGYMPERWFVHGQMADTVNYGLLRSYWDARSRAALSRK